MTAAERAGALGLLDLGRDADAARRGFAELGRRLAGGARYGVRVPAGCPLGPGELPAAVDTVLLADPASHTPGQVAAWAAAAGRPRVWAEVTEAAEARTAVAAGAHALVAKGHEGAGRVGAATTFVLLQQLLDDPVVRVPVHACGGIGPHTAAAAVAGGAAGVLLDVQLALTTEGEADLPEEVAAALRAMDGSETRLTDGHRVFARPDLPEPDGPVPTLLGARDLRTQLLPVGQDGASAARLAARYRTTGGVVQAVRAAVVGHLEAAVRARPLARPLPVAQGPMTRVSDQAAFAAAVATAGGVPYLALAVMEGRDVRRLLAQTAERLGDLPWGVGLLGFAPPELRREQLAAVTEARPRTRSSPVALRRRRPRWRPPGSGPTCTSPPPACWSATSPRGHGGSSSRGRSVADTSGPAPPSPCGRSRSNGSWPAPNRTPWTCCSRAGSTTNGPPRWRWRPRPRWPSAAHASAC